MGTEPNYDSVKIPPGLIPQPERSRPPQASAASTTAIPKVPPGMKGPSDSIRTESVKFTSAKAAAICERFMLSEQAALLLTDELTPRRYIDLLTENDLCPDAVRVLAYGLPKRDAVWWACLCLREALGANPPAKAKGPLEAAEKWAKYPNEGHRRDAQKAAETGGYGTPVGLTALAAFWSGGSMTPADAPVVPAAEHMTAEGVSGAVLLAAVGAAPGDVPKRQRRFLALGLAVACGK